ncbi:MAG: class I SAM-dependent methyltransferase [Candidatus Methylomirabilis oxygeniifera]|uniref:Putative Methyltransferase type 11 n=1 Tax=Methylomirabilis oxygeniifera TaxID=671143 RepID=D5MGG1_METO1|nr:MAG: class I SAM-dependent methyltransferase [Candidatus Methylomirabilis oxyfera]CBE68842.1 putative Methyltransferase type 11 [Candidatus Methylomirabilis oxyfera]
MTNATQLIQWKTDAWKDPRMVGWYSQRMRDYSGAGRLYHLIEPGLCETFTVGQKILDVGIGTGRASLPLARKGLRVTGVDSSHAMLDECRRLAGDTPITLLQGDVLDLPGRAADFDTIMALHVMVHFPHWRQVLEKWTAKIADRGRIIFDLHSLDHLEYIHGRRITIEELIRNNTCSDFSMYVGVEDIAAAADELGLTIHAIVPYGLLNNYSLYRSPFDSRPLNSAYWWRRHLSWIGVDNKLFDLCMFLETDLAFHLSSVTTGRFMVVLDKFPGKDVNHAWLERNNRLNNILHANASLEALSPYLPMPPEEWKSVLNRHLDHERNRVVFFFLWASFWKDPQILRLTSFLEERHARTFEMWWEQEQLDRKTSAIAQSWCHPEKVAGILNFRGVNLGAGMEYDFTRNLLEKYFQAFEESQS